MSPSDKSDALVHDIDALGSATKGHINMLKRHTEEIVESVNIIVELFDKVASNYVDEEVKGDDDNVILHPKLSEHPTFHGKS